MQIKLSELQLKINHKSPYFYTILLVISILISGIIFEIGFVWLGVAMIVVAVVMFAGIIAHAG